MKEHDEFKEEQEKPAALWKPILGVSVSGIALHVAIILIPTIRYLNVIVLVLLIFLLIISLVLLPLYINWLVKTINKRREIKSKPQKNNADSKDKNNIDLLHKLLQEGKITVEEYDRLAGIDKK